MHDAGNMHASLPPVLGLGLVKSGFGSGYVSSPPATDFNWDAQRSFDLFWAAWPRSEGKADARKAWDKAIRKTTPHAIVYAAETYAAHPHRPAKQFVPHAATWLNGERWDDDLPTAPEPERGKLTPTERAQRLLATDIDMKEIGS